MRRLVVLALALAGMMVLVPLGGTSGESYGVRNCSNGLSICTEVQNSIGANGAYTGHDEPSLLFYSDTPGSGNSNLYRLTLPTDPKTLPNQIARAHV